MMRRNRKQKTFAFRAPAPPRISVNCPRCNGTAVFTLHDPDELVVRQCVYCGRGWEGDEIREAMKHAGFTRRITLDRRAYYQCQSEVEDFRVDVELPSEPGRGQSFQMQDMAKAVGYVKRPSDMLPVLWDERGMEYKEAFSVVSVSHPKGRVVTVGCKSVGDQIGLYLKKMIAEGLQFDVSLNESMRPWVICLQAKPAIGTRS